MVALVVRFKLCVCLRFDLPLMISCPVPEPRLVLLPSVDAFSLEREGLVLPFTF